MSDPAPEIDPATLDQWMGMALKQAALAGEAGEVPIGCIVIHLPTGRVVGLGQNRRETDEDPTAHAEIVALREAGRNTGHWRLIDCVLVVTLEPCPMCAGAIVNARVPFLVYGCTDPKAGAVHTLYQLCQDARLNHRVTVTAGIRANDCGSLLTNFFKAKRNTNENGRAEAVAQERQNPSRDVAAENFGGTAGQS